ncbi:Endonuclease/exonuclease/phosphatase,Reverse transcriptase domain [Cinara cedri]|uniref:Endonuclease/exonuclease/phosphatase,Reverse transcriptase domain n=1 Tax=Cinara cedri TaxID=506608 RepID=A0A5E4N9S5_9HEMI|nr:Endonuclease/exonuclease/phosphatase,Reverse transcriptase domain [Cinara cedri]
MCYIRITGCIFDLIIINFHAPTEDKRDDIKEDFYEELDRICDITSNYSVKIVLGDFNAKVGKEEVYRPTIGRDSLHDTSNDNGTRLINFCMTNGMVLSSTYFPRKDIHKQTWVAPNQVVKNQIDHIMIQNRHKGCIQNITFRGADSDHYLVIAKFMTRLSVHWRENKGKLSEKFCTEKFAEECVSNEFAHTMHHETLRLNNENNDENVEHIWKKIKTTVINSAKSCLGKEKRKIEEIEKNRFNSKKFFSNSKDVKQGYKQQTRMVRNQTGDLLTNEKDIAEEFKNYYKMLLNKTASRPSDATYIQYSTAEPSLEKVIREINHSHQVEVVNKEIILAYADDIVILGNSRQDITQTMSNLVTASKRMGLRINEEKQNL